MLEPCNWADLIARLKQAGMRNGLTLMQVQLIVLNGELVGWTRPVETRIEPSNQGGAILKLMELPPNGIRD
jgi:hypothetical protein